MIGALDPTQKKAVIVGAGISGLLIAYSLKKRGFQVKVFEANDRAGGLISTEDTQEGMVERAAHSLLVTPEARTFFKELGVELVPIHSDSRARYIYRDGKMRKMPLRFFEMIQTLIAIFSRPKVPFSHSNDSLETWGNLYLGKAASQFLLAPFVTGIFATAPKELLASLAFPKFVPNRPGISLFKYLRSRKKTTRPQMMAPRNGMSSLIEALQSDLKDQIELRSPITVIPDTPNLILTVPATALSKLIRKEDLESAEALLKVKYAPLITATCFFHEKSFSKKPRGVGVLIPRGEGLRILGCLFNSSSFPKRVSSPSIVSLTVMIGGTEDIQAIHLSDEELHALINRELGVLLHATAPAIRIEITRWERAIPVYNSDLKLAQDALRGGFCSQKGRVVFSNFSKEVSIRGLIDASHQL